MLFVSEFNIKVFANTSVLIEFEKNKAIFAFCLTTDLIDNNTQQNSIKSQNIEYTQLINMLQEQDKL